MDGNIVRVLIVEDDPACTDLYAWYLRGDSDVRYEPTIVDTGAAALAAIRQRQPDCAIFDFQLPDMTGLDLLATLSDGAGAIPFAVVMVSAHASTELASAALRAGALDCLDKTRVTEAGLRRAIRTALERSRLRAQIEAQRRAVDEQARRTRQILERITDGFFALDRAWRFNYVNPIAQGLFGGDSGSILGTRLSELFPELVESPLFVGLERALASGEPASFETVFEPRRIWLEVHIYPDAEGLSVYFHDITSRKEAETERERQLVRGQTLLRMVRGFAAEADPERLVGSIAQEALRLLSGDRVSVARWDAQDEQLTPIATLFADGVVVPAMTPAPAIATPVSLTQAVEQRQPVVVNHPAAGRGRGRLRARAEVAAPLIDDGRLIGAIAVTSCDTTRRFGLEDAELLEVLAGLAAATIVGHEEARRDGVLLSARTAQHEVNNRLSLVRGYGEIVADHPDLPEDLRRPVSEIVRAAHAAADILRRLGRVDAMREIEWGPGLRTTIDLTDSTDSTDPPAPQEGHASS